MTSLFDLSIEAKRKFGTEKNTYHDFMVGTHVKIIVPCQDYYFFWGETGKVIKNTKRYLGICVEFDKPRKFQDGYVQKSFGFEPDDLIVLDTDDYDFQI